MSVSLVECDWGRVVRVRDIWHSVSGIVVHMGLYLRRHADEYNGFTVLVVRRDVIMNECEMYGVIMTYECGNCKE